MFTASTASQNIYISGAAVSDVHQSVALAVTTQNLLAIDSYQKAQSAITQAASQYLKNETVGPFTLVSDVLGNLLNGLFSGPGIIIIIVVAIVAVFYLKSQGGGMKGSTAETAEKLSPEKHERRGRRKKY